MNKNFEIPEIKTLYKEKINKDNSKKNLFNIVLNKCIEKIIYTNKHTDKTFIIFEVPHILIGTPSYDKNACVVFLINELKKKEYKVEYIDPYYLYIDWGSNFTKENKIDNLESYIYTSNPEKLKKQTKQLLKKFPNTSKIVFEYSKKNQKK